MKYTKKPLIIEAVQYLSDENSYNAIIEMGCPRVEKETHWEIQTLEGNMICSHGDYVIKGVNGEFYPCKPDIFEKSYKKTEEEVSIICANCIHWENTDQSFLGECKELLQSGSMLSDTGNVIPPLFTQFDFACNLWQQKI